MSHRYRLVPDSGQEAVLVRHCVDSRQVWNTALEQFNGSRRAPDFIRGEHVNPSPIHLDTVLKLRDGGGLSLVEIAAILSDRYGYEVTPNAISTALSRAGKASGPHKKHTDTIPWTVRNAHQMGYPARMLRLLGRRRRGENLSENNTQLLDSWLRRLDDQGLVVGYCRDTQEGWFYLDRELGDGGDIPIRSEPLEYDASTIPSSRSPGESVRVKRFTGCCAVVVAVHADTLTT